MRKWKLHPDTISPLYVAMGAMFVCLLMIANLAAGRLISFFGLIITGDLLLFPLTYILGDVLTEVYGFKRSRLIIWLGFLANVIMATYFYILVRLPYPTEFVNNASFEMVLGSTPLIVFASILAYFGGEFVNAITLSVMKKFTKGKWLFSRTIGSTILGQLVDTLVFMLIVFGKLPVEVLLQMIVVQYVFKVGYEILATPLTYLVVNKIKAYEKLDTFDYGVKYNPFGVKI